MAIPFYDISVATYLQILPAVAGVLEKGKAYFEQQQIPLDDALKLSLHPTMSPLSFQIRSVIHHAVGAMQAVEEGRFQPPSGPDFTFLEGQANIAAAIQRLEQYDANSINELANNDIIFEIAGNKLPFKANDFILTFSLPNFYFHATTLYDILRMQGVEIGKRDFIGRLRLNL